jgi:hypothetical protein
MAQIREDILTDIQNEALKAGIEVPIGPGSHAYAEETGTAGSLMFAHARIDSAKDACTPLTAPEGVDLNRFKRSYRLPDVNKSQASGKVAITITGNGSATIPNGQPGTIDGQRFTVVNGPWDEIVDGGEVDVNMDNFGSKGNKKAGTKGTFLNPPNNVSPECKVSKYKPIVGGYDDETPSRLRERILNRTGTNPGGGNWGQLREIAFNASPAVQQAFVYPGLFGPSTDKVVILREFDLELLDFSREFPDGAQTGVRGLIHAAFSTGFTGIVETATNEPVDVALRVELPNATIVGGAGGGWSDGAPWPQLAGPTTKVSITSVGVGGQITINASTTIEPIPGLTRCAWWSPNDMKFHVRTVVTFSGTAGAWVVTPDVPFVDSAGNTPATGQYISPNAENLSNYAKYWVELMGKLGPGENTNDPQLIYLGRALRHPIQEEGWGSKLGMNIRNELKMKNPEMGEIEYSYRSLTQPSIPANVELPPNVLVPRHFGIYPV